MTCKDCIHYEMCQTLEDNGQANKIHPRCCSCFADRSKFIKLPCKVGDTVYYIFKAEIDRNAINGFIVSEPIKITEVGTRGFWTSAFPNEHPDDMDNFEPWDSIDKTVFLTKEAAEQALRGENNEISTIKH